MKFFEMHIFFGKINNFKNVYFFYKFIDIPR